MYLITVSILEILLTDDIVEGIVNTLDNPPKKNLDWDGNKPDPATSKAPWCIYYSKTLLLNLWIILRP